MNFSFWPLKKIAAEQAPETLFIVGHGRDGSTLLQHLINSSADGADIRGENLIGLQVASIIGTLMTEKHFDLRQRKKLLESAHPWYGADQIDKERVMTTCLEIFKNEILSNVRGLSLVGFKEVRWFDLPHIFPAIHWMYPDSKFLFLERDPKVMAMSAWWKETESAVERILERQGLARDASRALGPNALTVSLERILGEDTTRKDIEEFLGRELDHDRWQSALREPLSHKGGRPPWELVRGEAR